MLAFRSVLRPEVLALKAKLKDTLPKHNEHKDFNMTKIKNILKPKTWSEVYEALFEDTYNARINRYKSRFAYRGVSSESYKMETSLMRLGGEYSKVENHLIRQFKKYAYKHIEDKKKTGTGYLLRSIMVYQQDC